MDTKTLIIGASGFIGSALLKEFVQKGEAVKAASRSPEKLEQNNELVQPVQVDLEDKETIQNALKGIKTVYYLAHSMAYAGEGFQDTETRQAQNLADSLKQGQKVIYLGGIVPKGGGELSPHLKSREKVGEILRQSKARSVEFRASIVIGRGSASFEMIRALVNRLPFIINPSWSNALSQPIALKDVVSYLYQAKDLELKSRKEIIEIGGTDKLTYNELLVIYAREQKLIRPRIKADHLPKNVAREFMKIVLPEYFEVGSKLLESIEAHTIVTDDKALSLFSFEPMGYVQAIHLAADPSLKEIPMTEILSKIKGHPEIPSYLAGQTLQYNARFGESDRVRDFLRKASNLVPGASEEEGFTAKIPFVGEIKAAPDWENNSALIAYKPKYFFQAAGWSIFNQLLETVKNSQLKKG